MKKKLIAFMAVCIMFLTCVSNISAQEISPRANDTVSRNYSQVFSYNKYFVSIDPDVGTVVMPNEYKTVNFQVTFTGAMQFDRITGKYVSASSPTASLTYDLPIDLGLYNVSTSKYDGGGYVTFSYRADVKGVVDVGIPITINYGSVSDSFSVNK